MTGGGRSLPGQPTRPTLVRMGENELGAGGAANAEPSGTGASHAGHPPADRSHGHAHGGHGHDGHQHGAALMRAGVRYQRPLTISFVLIGVFFVVEVVGGLWTNSLALLSDAGHMRPGGCVLRNTDAGARLRPHGAGSVVGSIAMGAAARQGGR